MKRKEGRRREEGKDGKIFGKERGNKQRTEGRKEAKEE